MESFEFEIEFDEARERKALNAQLKRIWKKNITIAYIFIGFGALLLILKFIEHGSLIVDGEPIYVPLFVLLFGGVLLFLRYKSKKMSHERLRKVLDVLKTKASSTTFINDTNFGVRGGFGDCALHWNSFSTIDYWDGYLLVYHAGKGTTPISISVDEVGKENFERVLAAVKTKIDDLKNEVQ
ncbi:MAG: hypothetical protein GQ574_06085 [Crocinitomix sp.]|nr:hypothetical protein [Crocinitomix sp.]